LWDSASDSKAAKVHITEIFSLISRLNKIINSINEATESTKGPRTFELRMKGLFFNIVGWGETESTQSVE
jgi:hypothetical protein